MINIEKLNEMNHWWKTRVISKELTPSFKRELYYKIREYIENRQITAIIGLRRTGKSTLFFQIIEELINKKVKPENILYFSFDESNVEIDELIKFYKENILKKDLREEKIYIFFDEIQKLKDWENKIKIYYDLYPKIKFFVSGSASINILINSKESLAGRIFYFDLDVLSFEEFLSLNNKDVEKIKKNLNLWNSELKISLNEYLIKPFPEIINSSDEFSKRYIKESITDKILFKDLKQLFNTIDIDLLETLINIIASEPGIIINLDDLSKDIKRSRQLISSYLYYLEYCFIIKSLKNFRGSYKISSRKLKKYYLIHPSLANALSYPKKGKLIENLVQFKLKSKNYWRDGKHETDFVQMTSNKIIPIESKYSNAIKTEDIEGLLEFMERFKIKQGIVITEDLEKEEKINGKKIKFVPLWKWLLEDKKK